jgi:hypothetical protein
MSAAAALCTGRHRERGSAYLYRAAGPHHSAGPSAAPGPATNKKAGGRQTGSAYTGQGTGRRRNHRQAMRSGEAFAAKAGGAPRRAGSSVHDRSRSRCTGLVAGAAAMAVGMWCDSCKKPPIGVTSPHPSQRRVHRRHIASSEPEACSSLHWQAGTKVR